MYKVIGNNTTEYQLLDFNQSKSKNVTADGEFKHELWISIVIGITLGTVIFLAIAGNIVVCVAVFVDRHLRKVSNFFIVSLAVADLLVAILVMTFALANDILLHWIFGDIFCTIWMSFDIMCSTASILNLCAISLDRYQHIRDPLRYEQWMTTWRALSMIATVWLLSALISFLPLQMGWHRIPSEIPPERSCQMELNPVYAIVSSCISFFLPCIVMITIYCRLYMYARKHVRSIKKTWTVQSHNGSSPNKQGSYKVSDHKAAMTLGVIMGVFLFCWVPFFTINIISAFCGSCIPGLVIGIFTWLGYVNSMLNPIIYSIFNVEFREAFKKVLGINHCFGAGGKGALKSNGTFGSEYGSVLRKSSRAPLMGDRTTVTQL